MVIDFRLALIQKAWLIVESCKTPEHAQMAVKWLDLVDRADSTIDTNPHRQELQTLFDPDYYRFKNTR